jgi:alpha-1,2-mannosyltransferase
MLKRPDLFMPWFQRQNVPLLLGLFLAIFCLVLYVGHLYLDWGPTLARQSLCSTKIDAPVAQDFPLHWTASFLALAGTPGAVYDFSRFGAVEKDLTGIGPHPWPYPPSGLLVDLPLALTPYCISLLLWLGVTLSLYLLVLYRLAPHPLTLLWALAFFGTFENFYYGQNGFLSAAMLGGGLMFLPTYPFSGGLLLGLLSYKPHIAVLIPLALVLGRQWRALWGALLSGSALALASAGVFGLDIWLLFFHSLRTTINHLHTKAIWFAKMPSIFAAVRLAGHGPAAAWLVHGSGMAAAIAILASIWLRPAPPADRALALVIATLLFSPHIWYYDLTLLTVPLAWLWWDGCSFGWFPGEQLLLLLSWAMPLVNFLLAVGWHWPVGPLYVCLPLLILLRRQCGSIGQPQAVRRITYARID